MKKHAVIVALTAQLIAGAGLSWGASQITSLPKTINTSGEYYLASNLTSSGNGIIINASNVSIDLKGHTIKGSSNPGAAISLATNATNIKDVEIANGSITNFTRGITLWDVQGVRVINLRLTNISHDDIDDASLDVGVNSLIKDSVFADNYHGPSAQDGSIITGNTSINSQGHGFWAGSGSIIQGNAVYGSLMEGIGGRDATIKNNSVFGNHEGGILPDGNCLVDGNTAVNNDPDGLGWPNMGECSTCVFGANVAP